jgi:type I restriction enzyme, S subunit
MKFEMAKIGDLCDLITKGTTPTTLGHRFTESGISFVKVESLTEDGQIDESKLAYIDAATHDALKRSQLRSGDILFTIAGTIGRVGKVPDSILPANTNQAVALLRPNPGLLDGDFLLYSLRKQVNEGRVASGVVQAVQANFSLGSIRELALLLPRSVDEQRQVVRILCLIDSKIDANRRINQSLEAMAQAIFKSWFVDFDPVKAKITAVQGGRDPLRAAMSTISGKPDAELDTLPPEQYDQLAATAALFPDEMEESELGEIPKGWVVSDMRSLSEVISKGTTPNKLDLATAKDVPIVPFVKVKDISEDGEIARGSLELIARSIHESSLKRSILKTDDLLFSIAGTIGRTAFVDSDLNGANVNQAIAFIRLKEKLDHFALCWLTLRNIETKNFIASKVVQAVQANASLANVGEIPVRLPCNDVLKKWNSVVSPLILEYRARLGEIRTLATLRDTLLPKLMSGELSATALAEPTGVA